jgi:hypothetical protein
VITYMVGMFAAVILSRFRRPRRAPVRVARPAPPPGYRDRGPHPTTAGAGRNRPKKSGLRLHRLP